ncbi:DAF-7 protein [Aphelenchoides fujianensis]|nr:DAF-7 protein [Aphelenchoides fujianensis]
MAILAYFRPISVLLVVVAAAWMQLASATNTKRCATCTVDTFEEYKQIRQQQILNDLLFKLELPAKPNNTADYEEYLPALRGHAAYPDIKDMIEATIREKKRSKRALSLLEKDFLPYVYQPEMKAPPQMAYVMAERAPWPLEDSLDISMFRLGGTIRKKYINKADLHAYVRRPSALHHLHQAELRVDVYERFINGTVGDKIATKYELLHGSKPVFKVTIPLNGLDVQTWVQTRAMESREPFVGVYVEAVFEGENLAFHPRDRYPDNMYLELEMFDMPGRSRRNANPQTCTAGSNETKCCLYDLMIDFEKVGWDFVLAPKRYNAYICNGDCATQVRFVQQRTRTVSSLHGTVTSQTTSEYFQCCHPKEYMPIKIVYVTEENVVQVREVPGMVASKCGCA